MGGSRALFALECERKGGNPRTLGGEVVCSIVPKGGHLHTVACHGRPVIVNGGGPGHLDASGGVERERDRCRRVNDVGSNLLVATAPWAMAPY